MKAGAHRSGRLAVAASPWWAILLLALSLSASLVVVSMASLGSFVIAPALWYLQHTGRADLVDPPACAPRL